jgi:hypothetical protein
MLKRFREGPLPWIGLDVLIFALAALAFGVGSSATVVGPQGMELAAAVCTGQYGSEAQVVVLDDRADGLYCGTGTMDDIFLTGHAQSLERGPGSVTLGCDAADGFTVRILDRRGMWWCVRYRGDGSLRGELEIAPVCRRYDQSARAVNPDDTAAGWQCVV